MRTAILTVALLPAFAAAGLKPEFTYNGVGKPLRVKVSGGDEIRLLEPVTGKVLASAKTDGGSIDVATKLNLWTLKPKGVTYLQLFEKGKAKDSALVFQPMTNAPVSTLSADAKSVVFTPDEDQTYAGFRVWVDQDAEFDTSLGKIRVRMRPDAAPNTVWNFIKLIEGGYYRDVIFHRVVAKRADGNPFVIQGGDPTGTGSGSPGYAFPLEQSPLPHDFGVISMARSTDPNTNGSQFFFALSRNGTKHLDGRYASFGEAISGADTILKIAAVPCGKEDRPNDPPVIKSIRLVNSAPYGTGPKVVTRPN